MKADVQTAKLMEVTCAELRGITLEDLEEGKDYNQNILYEKFLNKCLKINYDRQIYEPRTLVDQSPTQP